MSDLSDNYEIKEFLNKDREEVIYVEHPVNRLNTPSPGVQIIEDDDCSVELCDDNSDEPI
jgi:hypothetical protein